VHCKKHEDLVQFFSMEMGLVASTDIDSSKLRLNAVLLHNGKSLPSLPVGHSVHSKESYENTKILMEAINYDKFKLQISCDLKVIALLLGLQQGFTKYCCFICEWNSRAWSSLLKKGLACQKISGDGNQECGKSSSSGTE